MLRYFLSAISRVFLGAQGVKEIRLGTERVYARPGGAFYLTLKTEE